MVEDETKRYRPTKNYLEYFPTPTHTYEVAEVVVLRFLVTSAFICCQTPILKAELERISNRQPMEMLSMKRYSNQYIQAISVETLATKIKAVNQVIKKW